MLDGFILGHVKLQRRRIEVELEGDCTVRIGHAAGALTSDDQTALGEQEDFIAGDRGLQTGIGAGECRAGRGRQRIDDRSGPAAAEAGARRRDLRNGALGPSDQSDGGEDCGQPSIGLIVRTVQNLDIDGFIVDDDRTGERKGCARRSRCGQSGESLRIEDQIAELFLPEQVQRIAGVQRIDRSIGEVGAAALGVAVAITGRRKHGLVGGDREEAREFLHVDVAPGRQLDGEQVLIVVTGIEDRIDRDRRFVVEQNDQLLADMNERDLFVGYRGEIELDLLIKSEMYDHRLIC